MTDLDSLPAEASAFVESVELSDHETTIGMIFVSGAGYRVGATSNGEVRHMSAAAALRLSRELGVGAHAGALAPVSAALKQAAIRVLGASKPSWTWGDKPVQH